MTLLTSRARFLAGAAFGLGVSALAPQQAMAACTYAGGTYTCAGTTTTTDTVYAANTPNDRTITFPAGPASNADIVVTSGAVVNGYGLAITTPGTVGPDLHVTNNGTVSVDIGNIPITGAFGAAIGIVSAGTNLTYGGSGDVFQNSTGPGIFASTTGTGTINLNIGGSVRAESGHAVLVNGGDGNITVTTTAGETIRATTGSAINVGSFGAGNINITNAANISSANAGSITNGIQAFGFGTGNVSVSNTGAIGTATDRTSDAIFATVANAGSAGTVSVTGSGPLFAVNRGIVAQTVGTGGVAVNYTGPISTTFGNGIQASATSGPLTVTSGAITAAGNGIAATSTTGNQTITVNGAVSGGQSGITTNATGTRAITVGTGGSVAGTTQAINIDNAGAATITNAGTIGAAATGLAVNVTGGANTALTNQATGIVNGRLTFGGGVDAFSNSGIWNTQGTTDFGAGADTLTNAASGTINLTGSATLANLETLTQSGRINLNTFTLTGTGTLANAGFIDTSGSAGLVGFTTLSNSGTIDLAAGTFTVPAITFTNTGTIIADEGATTITGQTSFANSGTIDLQDGAVGDVLTINSPFSATAGSNLLVDFTDTSADHLVITGATTGTTTVNANQVGGGLLNLDGVLVVDTTTAASTFVLGTVGGNVSPLVDYSLVQSGTDYFLVSAPNQSLFDPLAVPVLAGSLWYQSADEIIANTRLPAVTSGFSFWGQIYGGKDEIGDHDTQAIQGVAFDTDNEIDVKRLGVQAGVDYGWGNGRIGITGGWAKADADHDNASDLDADGWNVGIYGQFGGPTGFHGEILAKYDRYNIDFDNGLFDGVDADARSFGVDGALGYRFGLGGSATLDANIGASHVRTKIDDFDAFGFSYDLNSVDSTRGRAGLRAEFGGGWKPYLDATVYHEFDGKGRINLFDGAQTYDLDAGGKGTWVRLEGGITGGGGPGPMLAAWADLGHRQGFGLRAGWRLGGGTAEVLPPPPPPPPPPPAPPATQTCADGSVILATDACLPPPPPPPPPPPVERGERG